MCIVVVVLLGVLSMRRAAVIGKSIPDGTNQLAPKYTVIRIRRRTDGSAVTDLRDVSHLSSFYRDGSSSKFCVVEKRLEEHRKYEKYRKKGGGPRRKSFDRSKHRRRFCSPEKEGTAVSLDIEFSSFESASDIGRARSELSI